MPELLVTSDWPCTTRGYFYNTTDIIITKVHKDDVFWSLNNFSPCISIYCWFWTTILQINNNNNNKKKNILDELEVVLIIAALSCNMLDLLTIKLTTIPECYPIGEPCVFINTRNCNSPPGL